MQYTELGAFSHVYRTTGVYGMGLSASSNFTVLYEAGQQYLRHGPPLCQKTVARRALQFERRLAGGQPVAADDVYPIAHGGVVKVVTAPKPRVVDGVDGVTVEPIDHDPRWIAEHVLIAFDPKGERHDTEGLLKGLFGCPTAAGHVRHISSLAEAARAAIAGPGPDIRELARAVNDYRRCFDQWQVDALEYVRRNAADERGGRPYTSAVAAMAAVVQRELGDRLLGWKPPGAGASASLILLVADRESRDWAIKFLKRERKWRALPAYVTQGVCGEFVKPDGAVRITAGHRLDFVGAADLGQGIVMAEDGVCCSCAVEPRAELVLSNGG